MSNLHIVLATPTPITSATSEENLGIGYIAAYCRSKGVQVTIIDGWMENLTEEEIAKRIIDCGDILFAGFSCYHLNMNIAFRIVETLRKNGYSAPLIAGGFGPTFSPKDFILGGFDIVVLCEGEETVYSLCKYYHKNEIELHDIPGICFKSTDGTIVSNNPKIIADVDALPFPSRDTMHLALEGKTPVDVLSSRGCTGNCAFCSVVAFWKKGNGNKYRSRSITDIVDELEELVAKGAEFIKFVDDSFIDCSRDISWCQEFSEAIIKRNLKIRYRIMMRVNSVNKELLEHLCKSGMISMQLGIENFSPTALRRMGKSVGPDRNIEAMETVLELQKKYTLFLQIGFILFDHATTLDELEINYEYLKKYSWAVNRGFTEMYAACDTIYSNQLNETQEAIPAAYGNFSYEIRDPKVRQVYNALKAWHVNYLALYH